MRAYGNAIKSRDQYKEDSWKFLKFWENKHHTSTLYIGQGIYFRLIKNFEINKNKHQICNRARAVVMGECECLTYI